MPMCATEYICAAHSTHCNHMYIYRYFQACRYNTQQQQNSSNRVVDRYKYNTVVANTFNLIQMVPEDLHSLETSGLCQLWKDPRDSQDKKVSNRKLEDPIVQLSSKLMHFLAGQECLGRVETPTYHSTLVAAWMDGSMHKTIEKWANRSVLGESPEAAAMWS